MTEKRISDSDLDQFLRNSRNAIMDQRGEEVVWFIDGAEYSEVQARKLAEYCSITGQHLTSIATIEGALNIARRVMSCEVRIANLNKVITELVEDRKTPWWRRG